MAKTWVRRIGVGLLAMGLVVAVVFAASPWPSALIVREVFQKNAEKVAKIMEPYAPSGVTAVLDLQYAEASTQPYVTASEFTQLDVFYPAGTTEQLGTVIWTHGGTWVSGNKANDRTYFELLASKGFTVVGVNYTYGPEAQYPTAVFELNQAHQFLIDNAADLHIDPNRIVLAGDSAGAQLASQLATLITSPDYAAQLSFEPVLAPSQLQGVVLNCGVYDVSTLLGQKGILGWGDDASLWAYTGDRDLANSTAVAQMSTLSHVTAEFPATYISGGNADPLTAGNSKPFASRLSELGVDVTELFWPEAYTPALPHEYQFRLNLDAAQQALTETTAFLETRLG